MQKVGRSRSGVVRACVLLACFAALCGIALPDAAEARRYPKLFGSYELYSTRIARFAHWVSVLERVGAESAGCEAVDCGPETLASLVADLKDAPLDRQLREVNARINAQPYAVDSEIWADPDYWATPAEFLAKGGDCEDYAVAKYMALRALGVPAETLRIAVVWNSQSSSGHATVVVYIGSDAFLLDSLIPTVVRADSVDHYQAIYSINEAGWWLHRYLNPPAPPIS